MANQNAEQKARDRIDALLEASGWRVQDYSRMNLAAGPVAVREFPMNRGFGFADYLLYVDRKVLGVVEAKSEGATLAGVETQSEKYSVGLPDKVPAYIRPLPFLYQSTGAETRFTNVLDPDAASRDVFTFHRPEHLSELLQPRPQAAHAGVAEAQAAYPPPTLLARLRNMPPLATQGMRDCQISAITNLEKSFAHNRSRALIQMQMGSGKTYMAIAQAYRLIKFGGAKRILILVDRGNLARQTKAEFEQYVTPDDGRKFTELYNVQHLQSNKIDPVAKVVITTIQRLYSILQGEAELDPAVEEEPTGRALERFLKKPLPVVYNPSLPVEFFDFVFIDECHRSIYNLWRQVLEYFDAYLIGLTATPSKQTLGFFHQNLVMEYGHAQAVVDKVNVDFSVYRIQTKITAQGETIQAGLTVDKRDRKTRRVRWEALDADLAYTPNQLDKAVVAVDQIRTVMRTFRDKLFTEIFPGRTEVPKTLIFAKDDSHAEDIVRIVREEFGKGNDFCQKLTYRTSTARVVDPQTGELTYKNTGVKVDDLLKAFRNSYSPRIAVTVDMIATGTDVKPLEIVFFMRDVKSANYFDQMKGRGCRVMDAASFQGVTPDAKNKTRYVIVDAVGVTEHVLTDSPPLERQPTIPLKLVLQAVGAGVTDPDVASTLASRLSRLDQVLGAGPRKQLEELAGAPLHDLIADLVRSVDPDVVEAESLATSGNAEPATVEITGRQLREKALEPFLNPDLRNLMLLAQQDAEQTIDTVSQDAVLFAGASAEAADRARTTIDSFRQYIEDNKNEITAIQLLYSRRRGQAPTFKQLKELAAAINLPPRSWTPEALWQAYETLERSKVKGHGGAMVTDLVSLVRFALEQETILAPFAETVEDRYAAWLASQQASGKTFTREQAKWLEMIRDHIAASLTIGTGDFELTPFDQAGGIGRAYQVFGENLLELLTELNEALAA
ncbi:MAG: type I restriction endonuclease subunit R [Fimbriimonadaceae bacterium]